MKDLNDRKNGKNPRKIALLILNQYFKTNKLLKAALNQYLKSYNLSGLDRRFIYDIVKGTVRYLIRIDFLISILSDKKIADIDFAVLNILRIGAYQLLYMDKVPDYSAVDECVKLAKSSVSISSSKFVNAVLRKASSISKPGLFIEEKLDKSGLGEVDKLSVKYSYPAWLAEYWLGWYGKEKTVSIMESLNENPHIYLRFNQSRIFKSELSKKLKTVPDSETSVPEDMQEGTSEVSSAQDISLLDIHRKGLISVQDLSSQMAVKYFLGPQKNEKVLDLCAAPGGKTAYISELVGRRGEVYSVDISGERLKLLKSNNCRLKIKNVRIVEADASEPGFLNIKGTANDFEGYFDRILIDPPCSAFGTISKNPDVKYNKAMSDINRLSMMSQRMMVNSDRYLKAGGRLVFYTCTLSPLENQKVIDKFLNDSKGRYEKEDTGFGMGSSFEIMPYHLKSEGGFACRLIKKNIKQL